MGNAMTTGHDNSVSLHNAECGTGHRHSRGTGGVRVEYIISRSESLELGHDIVVAIELGGIEIYRNVQWEDDDLVPIAKSIDDVFQKLRWR